MITDIVLNIHAATEELDAALERLDDSDSSYSNDYEHLRRSLRLARMHVAGCITPEIQADFRAEFQREADDENAAEHQKYLIESGQVR